MKCIKVIESCKTEDQLWYAHNYMELFKKQNNINLHDRTLLFNFWTENNCKQLAIQYISTLCMTMVNIAYNLMMITTKDITMLHCYEHLSLSSKPIVI